jgi:hypothetical protein
VVRCTAPALARPSGLDVRDDRDLPQGGDVVDDADIVDVVDVVTQKSVGYRGAQLGVDADGDDRAVQAVGLGRSWLSAGSTKTTWDRRGACSDDTGLLADAALQVAVAGVLPQHARLR